MTLRDKDHTIAAVVRQLRLVFGDKYIDMVDHWDGDLCAIGIAVPGDHAALVYISTYGLPAGRYTVHLEMPLKEGAYASSVEAGIFENTGFDELVQIVESHLNIGAQ